MLLADSNRSWKVLDLAKEARVSLGQASNVKKLLEDREWVERSTKGMRLSQPDKLRAAWASASPGVDRGKGHQVDLATLT